MRIPKRSCASHPAAQRSRPAQGRRQPDAFGAAWQAVPAAGREDPRFRLVPGLRRRHPLPRRDGCRKLQGRMEGQSGYPSCRHGAGGWTSGARRGDRPAAGGQGPRHGRPVQQQERRQARHLAEHPPPEGPCDRERPCSDLRYRRRGILARRAAATGPRLRCPEEDPSRHHLYSAGWHGRARRLRADAHRGSRGGGVRRPGRHVRPAGTGDASGLGLFLPRLDGRLRLCAGIAGRAVSPRSHRRGTMDRRLAMRVRIVPDRHVDSRLVSQRPRVASLRQPLAVQAGRPARCLPLQGQRPMGGHRLLHRGRMARVCPRRRPCRVAR